MSRTHAIKTDVFLGSILFTTLLLLLAYGVLRWMEVDPGSIKNWIVGLLVLWWLVLVVRLPWDLYFTTRELMFDTRQSKEKGMNVSESDLAYVERWATLSLILAIALHVITSIGLAFLQYFGVSELGYYASGAALLLMGFRPAGRAYDYLVGRLGNIGHEIMYPRDDVALLKSKIEDLQSKVKALEDHLNLEEEHSWAATIVSDNTARDARLSELQANVESYQQKNEEEHQLLAKQAEAATEKIAGGAQVVNHVRELVRFFKDA